MSKHNNSSSKGLSLRQKQFAELTRKAISEIFTENRFFNFDHPSYLTVNKVIPSADLKLLKTYIRFNFSLEGVSQEDMTKHLNQSAEEVRYLLAKKLKSKFAPAVKFYFDDTLDVVEEILETIRLNKKSSEDNDDI